MSAVQQLLMSYGAAAGDPYWSSVVTLLSFDGTAGSTTFTDTSSSPKTWTATGSAQLNATTKKFGTASLNAVSGYISTASNAGFGFGSGDFTIEGWIYLSPASGDQTFFDNRTGANTGCGIYVSTSGDGAKLIYANNAAVVAVGTTTFAATTFYHVAVARSGTTVRGFVNGGLEFTYTDSRTFASASTAFIGANYVGTQGMSALVDEVRVTKGVARYTAAFTAPSAPFPTS